MNRPAERSWTTKFRCAFRGLAVGMQGQDSFRVHWPMAVAVIVFAQVLHVPLSHQAVLLVCITLVLTAEYFNSALEWLAKGVDDRHNQNLGNALDIASAAVLTASQRAGLQKVGVVGLEQFGP